MSQFMPQREDGKPDSRGPEAYLSSEERKALQRALSFPEDLPSRFKSWILDHVVTNIQDLPISQLSGFSQFSANGPFYTPATETRTSATYGDLATVGPQITGLSDGRYLLMYGNFALVNTAGSLAAMSVQVNDTLAVGADACYSGVTSGGVSVSIAVLKNLAAGGSNTVTSKYAREGSAGTATFSGRWLLALKTGN